MEETQEPTPAEPVEVTPFELGAWTGRSQAFELVAHHCSAAQAACLKHIHDTRGYEAVGLTWDEFCERHLGISKSYANKIIQRLEEFGKPFFDLLAVAPIAADKYRAIAPQVSEEGIEIEGEIVPLTPENAPRIRGFIDDFRAQLRQARALNGNPDTRDLVSRFDVWFSDVSRELNKDGRQVPMRGLARYAIRKLTGLVEKLPKAA